MNFINIKLPHSFFLENATLALTVSAFRNSGSYYNLETIDTRLARDIEEFFESGYLYEFQIKVKKNLN